MKATLLDFGAGNLHSIAKAIEAAGADVAVETDPERAVATDLLVLPGVGAFSTGAARLAAGGDAIRAALDRGLPCLGICLGMQLLFEDSEEGAGPGLGVIAGHVTRLAARRLPQIGWNAIDDPRDPLFERAPVPIAYFANSYACRPDDDRVVVAWTRHESDRFPAAVRRGSVLGVQFHPEKSSRAGLALIAAFVDEARP